MFKGVSQCIPTMGVTKSENRRTEQVLLEGEKGWGKGDGGRIWCKYCVYMHVNGKMVPVENIPGWGRVKENDGGVEFNYDIFDTL
jgi:hypothetical protein